MYRGETRMSEKCIACYPRVEGKDPVTKGRRMEARCMAACVGKIRMNGLLTGDYKKPDPKNPMDWLVHIYTKSHCLFTRSLVQSLIFTTYRQGGLLEAI